MSVPDPWRFEPITLTIVSLSARTMSPAKGSGMVVGVGVKGGRAVGVAVGDVVGVGEETGFTVGVGIAVAVATRVDVGVGIGIIV